MRAWRPLAVLVLAAVVIALCVAGGLALRVSDQRTPPRQGIDHALGVGGVQLLHDGCEPLLTGWHLSWGQPIRYEECGFRR